ncbi:MAG: BamA/TamA family outer membrane protein [Psychroserpens sp.]|nr:BamA/TamA family outer membrane protein [Psychroserpens sp.]MBO6630881.1 BamA/TamA family outer membrane protein [Psychroserpens sp.]MBO6652742.1 BamA/TamA family outer membrane protein [Psychroserpens sp.]MBO6681486.1 BamA/TamA family outer membrane protein [Psychroserpens sp.]MBO6749261.1 BamA/TamA family outer membrane protein [Psychroserpens sp.]
MSCDVMKRVKEDEHLLISNTVLVNDKKNSTEIINDLVLQKPNGKLLGIPLRLHIYNLARPNIDSILTARYYNPDDPNTGAKKLLSVKQYNAWVRSKKNFNEWLIKTGEAPAIFDESRAERTATALKKYYFSKGWFDVETSFDAQKDSTKRARVTYNVKTGDPYILDSISTFIKTPVMDSIYQNQLKSKSLVVSGEQYDEANFSAERDRLTERLRNLGFYHFGQDYITFDLDTINTNKKINTELYIADRAVREEDSITREPFKIYRIKEVNIFTDFKNENRNARISDSIAYQDYNLYSFDELKYRPKAITDAVFIHKGDLFRDIDRTRTYRYLSELRAFRYPRIEYVENEADTTLTANVFLVPRKKFELTGSFEISQSNIQTVGFAASAGLVIRNIFRGAETLEISGLAAIGSSRDASDSKDQFFDINELGGNLRLSIPRFFLPFNTDRIIPKYMSPSTRVSLNWTSQRNIGLDKQAFTGSVNYNWFPSTKVTNNLDLFNVQFVKNLNTDNYFGVYQNSFDRLNQIAQNIDYIADDTNLSIPTGADTFINDVLSGDTVLTPQDDDYIDVNNISQRKDRLTENNLIFSSSFNYVKNRRESLFDNDFSIIRLRLEVAGNLLSNISRAFNLPRNDDGRYEVFGVPFSQYVKTEVDYVKHWDLGRKNVLAVRSYFGIAIPYGNSNNIPFAESFFAGGPNDIRAWTAYNLGPGSSFSTNEFNEANFKITLSAEQRFNILGRLNGALFVDAGNIWNVFDNVEDDRATFDGFQSLEDMAVGSGFGLRYDFGFFVLRGDIGFRTYDPSRPLGTRWFKDYNFSNAVYNIGVNYPF